jgi:hypothetical protein
MTQFQLPSPWFEHRRNDGGVLRPRGPHSPGWRETRQVRAAFLRLMSPRNIVLNPDRSRSWRFGDLPGARGRAMRARHPVTPGRC